jgi:uncharacterized protein YuzE
MSKKTNLYVGKAGQFAAMSEFLMRGWNVAVPEVDVGDDIFVVRDENGEFVRVQIKAATAQVHAQSFSAQFSLPIAQLDRDFVPELVYCFLVRHNHRWLSPLLISRSDLLDKYRIDNIGTLTNGKLLIYFSFQKEKIMCSNVNFTAFANNFSLFPNIQH